MSLYRINDKRRNVVEGNRRQKNRQSGCLTCRQSLFLIFALLVCDVFWPHYAAEVTQALHPTIETVASGIVPTVPMEDTTAPLMTATPVLSSLQLVETGASVDAKSALKDQSSAARLESIPRRLLFTYKWKIFDDKRTPQHVSDNVQQTIKAYRHYWRGKDVEVVILDDAECLVHVNVTAPFLVPYFQREYMGAYKSDICRVCYLLRYGGYYFDVDMETIQPYGAEPNVTFVTVYEASSNRYFFQSFLASAPNNPILRQSLQEIKLFYDQNMRRRVGAAHLHMGPYTLKQAYEKVIQNSPSMAVKDSSAATMPTTTTTTTTTLLQEVNLMDDPTRFPNLTRRVGKGCCCNYVVTDSTTAYFRSRMVGAGPHCDFLRSPA